MLVAVIVLAVIAGLLAGLLLVSRHRSSIRHQNDTATLAQLRTELDTMTQKAVETAESAAAATQRADDAEAEAEAAKAAVEAAQADAEAAHDRALATETDHLAALAALAQAENQRADLNNAIEAVTRERDRSAHEASSLRERLASLRREIDHYRDDHRPGIEADALWALELARSERTWRHSVSTTPLGPSPFESTEDPLKLAVEVEVAALREDVGAPLEADWETPLQDPARCLIVLRVAQEILAEVAREQQAAQLRGRLVNNEVVLTLAVPEGEPTPQFELSPLPASLVTVETHDGLRITIH